MRASLLSRIRSRLRKRQHVLLCGEPGSGKSWLLDQVLAAWENPNTRLIRVNMSSPRKALLLAMAQQLHAHGCNVDADPDADWNEARKQLKQYTVEQLIEIVEPWCKDCLFALDDLHLATERTNQELAFVFEGIVLAAADDSKATQRRRIQPVINRMHRVEVPPLEKEEAVALLWSQLDRSHYPSWQALQTKVLNVSGGKPGVIMDLIARLGKGQSIGDIRDLEHSEAGLSFVGLLAPTLMIAMVLVISMRYLSHGFDDPMAYMLAAVAYSVFRVFSPILYRLST